MSVLRKIYRFEVLGFNQLTLLRSLGLWFVKRRCLKIGMLCFISLGFAACGGTSSSGIAGNDSNVDYPSEIESQQKQKPLSPEERRALLEAKRAQRESEREKMRAQRQERQAKKEDVVLQSPKTAIPPLVIASNAVEGIKPPPRGVYHSAGFLVSGRRAEGLVTAEINTEEFISGTLVRVGWSLINPSEGQFDFSRITTELERAAMYKSSINLAILDSKEIPDYVLNQCQDFSYTFRGTETFRTCLPWDPIYQKYKKELVSKLGEQFDSHPNLAGVYFSYSAMTNGIEMHWRVDENAFKKVGYSPTVLLDAYNTVMDMYIAAFKHTSIIMEVHEVFRSPALAEGAFEHCYDKIGARCGVAIWWCSSRMATNAKESEFSVYPIAKQAVKKSFAVCQTIGNFSAQPDRFDSGQGWSSEKAMSHEMDFFLKEGFSAFEIWTKDIKNPSLVKIIKADVAAKFK